MEHDQIIPAYVSRLQHADVDGDVGMFEFTFALVLPDGATHADSSVDVLRYEDGLIRSLRAYTDSHPLRRALGIDS
jgi:ketosteroid isomerase-like protein